MQAANAKSWIGNSVVLTIRENAPALQIDDATKISDSYMRQPPTPDKEPDKLQIKAALARGEEIPGVHLTQTLTLLRKGA